MYQLKEFKKINHVIHPLAEEVSIFNGKVEENLFDARTAPRELLAELIYSIGELFNEGIDMTRLEQFSFQDADGISYFEPKLMVVYSGGKEAAQNEGLPFGNAHEHYCVNYFLNSRTKRTKFYDLQILEHQRPPLPEGSELAYPFGLGVSWDMQRKDVYFVHNNMTNVCNFFNLPAPSVEELHHQDKDNGIKKIFGIAYEVNTLRPLKLKRYFYPPGISSVGEILFDEWDQR